MNAHGFWRYKSDSLFAAPLTILAACDSAYLKYAPALLRSLDLFSPGFDFVLHVVNPTEGDFVFCETLAKGVVATSVSISYEINEDIDNLEAQARKAYFASCRFMVAADLLTQADCPILCIDIDSVFINPIDMIFGPAGADVALVRRDDGDPGRPDHLKVAAGVVVYFPTEFGKVFASELSRRLVAHFKNGLAAWFVDQLTIFNIMTEMQETVRIVNLKAKYADFQIYKLNSIIWSAKGDNKEFLEPFVSLQNVLSDSPYEQVQGKHVLNRAAKRSPDGKVALFYAARPALKQRLPRSATIFVPRADRPMTSAGRAAPYRVDDETVRQHLKIREFVIYLANYLEARDTWVDVVELPAEEITASHVNAYGGDFALLPDTGVAQMSDLTISAAFYGRHGLPDTFTLRAEPVFGGFEWPANESSSRRAWTAYRKRLAGGKLPSQRPQQSADRDTETGRYDLFFPMGGGEDGAQQALVESLADFAKREGLALVLRPHPAGSPAEADWQNLVDNRHVFVSRDDLHALIDRSQALFTCDDDMAFEAMLHNKPIAVFGPAVGYPGTVAGRADDLVGTWKACRMAEGHIDYSGFFEWYCESGAIDLSRPSSRDSSLESHVAALIRNMYSPIAT